MEFFKLLPQGTLFICRAALPTPAAVWTPRAACSRPRAGGSTCSSSTSPPTTTRRRCSQSGTCVCLRNTKFFFFKSTAWLLMVEILHCNANYHCLQLRYFKFFLKMSGFENQKVKGATISHIFICRIVFPQQAQRR